MFCHVCSGICAANVQHGVQLSGLISEQILQVADKAVYVTFPDRLTDNVLVVVVSQTAAQLLVVHFRLVLSPPPQQSHLETVHTFKELLTKSENFKANHQFWAINDDMHEHVLLQRSLYTSSGSINLNSQPSPVQLIHD